jgi:uncharacterized protein YjbI with pentapeptide repeats
MNETVQYERILTTKEKSLLRGEAFKDRVLVGVDLSGADLRDARFERVVFRECTLDGADLRGTQFLLCDLHAVRLADARLGENRFAGTTLIDVEGLSESDRAIVQTAGGCFQPTRASKR